MELFLGPKHHDMKAHMERGNRFIIILDFEII